MITPVSGRRCLACSALFAAGAALATPLHGQRGASDSGRSSRVIAGIRGNGFSSAVVIGHGAGPLEGLFALTAVARDESGVLLVMPEPGGSAAHPVVVERAHTPADLGVHGVRFSPFLGTRDLVDVEVTHQPSPAPAPGRSIESRVRPRGWIVFLIFERHRQQHHDA